MSNSNDLLSRIKSSSAYHSISTEQTIVSCIKSYNWSASHSPFYCDVVTGKTREIDVIAIQSWEKGRKNKRISASLKLYIEAKSARDSHLLLSGRSLTPNHLMLDQYWIGYEEIALESIAETLSRANFDGQAIRNFLHKLEELAFPDSTMMTAPLKVAPFQVDDCFSAFRETTIGAEKELDNSVLWRALTVLRSAINAGKKQRTEYLLSDLKLDVETAVRFSCDPTEAGLEGIKNRASHLELFHPVVVIDSTLWSVTQEQPKQLKWFRFVQFNADGYIDWWADVVASSAFDEFAQALTNHYQKQYKSARAKRS